MIVFASDLHLGVPNHEESLKREKRFVQWLHDYGSRADEIFLVGDVFDFWFEYKHVVPKGYTRLLGTLADICDSGKPVHMFTGNHDLWMFGYLEQELGVQVHRQPVVRQWNGRSFYIGHGDGLGPGDHGYKFIKKVFTNRFFQFCFRQLHPDYGVRLAQFFSHSSRNANYEADKKFLGEDKEWLVQYIKETLQKEYHDYFIFGHRHLPLDLAVENSRYLNLGDWITYNTYGVWDGEKLSLEVYHAPEK